jgi:Putative lumazine-binding
MSIMAVAAMLAPMGCSLGADEEPQPVSGAPKAIVATVDRLERAVADGDYATVCEKLFTAAARKRSGGSECVAQMRSATEGVSKPSIEIQKIEVNGETAAVRVATEAEGQARVSDTLTLRRSGERWLVEALS